MCGETRVRVGFGPHPQGPRNSDEDMTTLDMTKNIAYMHICQVISSANCSIIYLCYPKQKYFTHFCVLSNCRCMGHLYNPHMKIRERRCLGCVQKVLSRHFWAKRRYSPSLSHSGFRFELHRHT